ncbi:F-box/FBD/LRR-repeat protein-like protein [Tanacetum coccineum]
MLPTQNLFCVELRTFGAQKLLFLCIAKFHGFPNLLSLKLSSQLSQVIFQLKLLPKLQELDLNFRKCKKLVLTRSSQPSFHASRLLTLSIVNFSSDGMLSFVMEMICGSPNLQNFNITATYKGNISRRALPSLDLDFNAIEQLLCSVVFSSFRGTENEVCLIKYVLACSPLLKNIVIVYCSSAGGDSGKFKFAHKLLMLHRASPIAEIGLY